MTNSTLQDHLGPLKPPRRRQWYGIVGLVLAGSLISYLIVVAGADSRAQEALWKRTHVLIARAGTSSTTVHVRDLFGADVDGVCVLADGFPGKSELVRHSPRQFTSVIDELERANPQSGFGPGGWFVFTIRHGKLAQRYKFNFGEDTEISSAEGGHACYGAAAWVRIGAYQTDTSPGLKFDFYSERNWGRQ